MTNFAPDQRTTPHPLTKVQLGDENCRIEATGHFRDQDAADYVPNPESEQLRIDVPVFEGPLDLLLHLIKKHSMDIFDIPIVVITQKYLEAIEPMKEVDIDLAGEFLLMAATLLHIKSKMLLPKEERPADEEADDAKDPRAELVKRLLEYQRFKEIALALKNRSHLGDDVFLSHGNIDASFFTSQQNEEGDDTPTLEGVQIFELLGLFADIIEAKQPQLAHTVKFEKISIRARMSELVEFSRLRLNYELEDALSYFQVKNRYDVIVTFLAVLECARLKLLTVTQDDVRRTLNIQAVKENLWNDGDEAYAEFGQTEEYE